VFETRATIVEFGLSGRDPSQTMKEKTVSSASGIMINQVFVDVFMYLLVRTASFTQLTRVGTVMKSTLLLKVVRRNHTNSKEGLLNLIQDFGR
jgi:hypothetical protein